MLDFHFSGIRVGVSICRGNQSKGSMVRMDSVLMEDQVMVIVSWISSSCERHQDKSWQNY